MLEFEPELNAAEYDTLSAIADVRIARAELRPQVTLDSSMGVIDRDRSTEGFFESGDALLQREITLSLRQLLFDGGLAGNHVRAAENAHLAQQFNEMAMIEARVVDLTEIYLEIIRVRRQIALAKRNVDNHRDIRDMLQERVSAGGTRADVSLVQGRLQLALNTLATHHLALDRAVTRFERLVGICPGELTYPEIPELPADWRSVDTSGNFDYLAALEALEAAEHRYRASRSRKLPKIYLDTGVTRATNTLGIRGDDNETYALISGQWDLFSGGRNRAYECREHFQVGKYEELVRAAEAQRTYLLRNLWREREGSMTSIEALGAYAEELTLVTSDYEEQFRLGRQELLNILDIQQEYYSVRSRLLDAKFDKEESVFRIMGVQGTLTRHLLPGGHPSLPAKGQVPCAPPGCHPDNRVPLTQDKLMSGMFEGEGPEIEIHPTPRHTYYVEKAQLPVTCDEDGKCDPCVQARKLGMGKSASERRWFPLRK